MSGLEPRAWAVIGSGYSREEFKQLLFRAKLSFQSGAVLTPADLALKILDLPKEKLISDSAREEALRTILGRPGILSRFPALKALRKKRDFFKKVDRALQQGRSSFAHWEEAQVMDEHLEKRGYASSLRQEIQVLARAYEAWLDEVGLLDLPALFAKASPEVETFQNWPRELYWFCATQMQPRELSFLQSIERSTKVTLIGPREASRAPRWKWWRWHTLDDATEALAEQVLDGAQWDRHAILIPDAPAVRRSLGRALASRGIPLAQTRDPTWTRMHEQIKGPLTLLRMVANGFEKSDVLSFLTPEQRREWGKEIEERGVRRGLGSYGGGKLEALHQNLQKLQASLGKKATLLELAHEHLKWITDDEAKRYFHSFWERLAEDELSVHGHRRELRLAYLYPQIRKRLEQAPPPVEALTNQGGVRVYRLSQLSLGSPSTIRLHLLGFPGNWLEADGVGDLWFSDREREVLGGEFAVQSAVSLRRDRLALLKEWFSLAEEATVWDAEFDYDGSERESLAHALSDFPAFDLEHPEEKGAFVLRLSSFGTPSTLQPQMLRLPTELAKRMEATTLDLYSRCPFTALALRRWKLFDQRESETELWPDVRGTLLHKAVELMVGSKFSIPEAIEQAWNETRPRGLKRFKRAELKEKNRLSRLLAIFLEKEKAFAEKSGCTPLSLEVSLEWNVELENGQTVSVHGRADRVDRHADGLVVMDYKTNSQVPRGKEILEQGYALQLPFYGLAVRRRFEEPVIGAHFIQLNRQGTRNSGLFFKKFNGKEPGKLSQLQNRSFSLVDREPDDVWSDLNAKVAQSVNAYFQGDFAAQPTLVTECQRCRFPDLCGRRRKGYIPDDETESGRRLSVP